MQQISKTGPALESRLMGDPVAVLALSVAAETGLMARLAQGPVPDPQAQRRDRGDALVLTMLAQVGLVDPGPDGWCMTAAFRDLWQARGQALATRARFQRMALADLMQNAEGLLYDLPTFMARAQTFRFFDYGRAMDTRAAALEDTAPWVDYVTALTEAEAPALVPHLPLNRCQRILEIGGNSGAFAKAILHAHPDLAITVMDLPAVCHLGAARAGDVEGRLAFHPGDARQENWPDVDGAHADTVLFKSVLHDWEDPAALAFLTRVAAYLPAGGQVVIAERVPLETDPHAGPEAWAANLVFAPFYRRPEDYLPMLEQAGFRDTTLTHVDLEMRFMILSARLSG